MLIISLSRGRARQRDWLIGLQLQKTKLIFTSFWFIRVFQFLNSFSSHSYSVQSISFNCYLNFRQKNLFVIKKGEGWNSHGIEIEIENRACETTLLCCCNLTLGAVCKNHYEASSWLLFFNIVQIKFCLTSPPRRWKKRWSCWQNCWHFFTFLRRLWSSEFFCYGTDWFRCLREFWWNNKFDWLTFCLIHHIE